MDENLGEEPGDEVTTLLCHETDLQDGQMKEVAVEKHKVLVVRTQGRYSAIGSRCTHYNAPLVKGALLGNKVRCPFHGACFNVTTGDIEEYPGLDCLPAYKVKVEDGNVYISFNRKTLKVSRRVKEMSSREPEVNHTTLLIGGGPAALLCAETLRQNFYKGRIVMVTKDVLPPFDKVKLSKGLNLDSSKILLRSEDFLKQYGIEVWTQKEVVSVEPTEKVVSLSGGTTQPYDQLLVSTGCRARPLGCPGQHLEGVHLLETYQDSMAIHHSCHGRRAVIVGASFIGMEVASHLSNKAASVVVVGNTEYPFENSLGPKIGEMAMKMFEENNVQFYMKDRVVEIRGEEGKFMKTNVADIYGAGDVTSFPLSIRGYQRVNIGHWQMAQAHGRAAALNMLNKPTEINSVPFFWTVLLGKSIRYAGYGEGYTEIIFKGKVEEGKFLAFYIKAEVVVAAASLMFDPAVARIAELMSTGQVITKTQAQSDDLSWLNL
ncbi:hypothetical protein CRUP_020222 [Coryphaenoides rupestris]|nr:hypothetical protein CRUP_020222 [Coryphaenoides rupestris]